MPASGTTHKVRRYLHLREALQSGANRAVTILVPGRAATTAPHTAVTTVIVAVAVIAASVVAGLQGATRVGLKTGQHERCLAGHHLRPACTKSPYARGGGEEVGTGRRCGGSKQRVLPSSGPSNDLCRLQSSRRQTALILPRRTPAVLLHTEFLHTRCAMAPTSNLLAQPAAGGRALNTMASF